ncbi:hypothetical protein [Roseateles sp.]|uniref:hypothetical protein n=1 Tax=Roseateles sp. TaxID=1971397 RepID=UPI0039E7400A
MAETLSGERIVLIGAPSLLSGLVRMSNRSAEALKIKNTLLRTQDGRELQLTLGLRVPPGVTAHARASVQLDPRTPPGDIRAEAIVGEEARDVLIRVLEHREVALYPQSFRIHGRPGAQVPVPAVLTNLGNVPFSVPRVALLAVSQAQGFEQMFHVAMAQAGSKGHQAALDLFAQMLGASEVDAPKVLFNAAAGKQLAAGDSVETELGFELPAKLARHGLYMGSFTLGGAQYPVEIEVDAPGSDEPVVPVPASVPATPAARKSRS